MGWHFDALPKRLRWVRQGPILSPHLGPGEPSRTDAALDASVKPFHARLHRAWSDAGVCFPPSAFEVAFPCSAHSPAGARFSLVMRG